MERREFIKVGAMAAPLLATPFNQLNSKDLKSSEIDLPPLPFKDEQSSLKITEIKMVTPIRKRPWPEYEPSKGSWAGRPHQSATPMSIYPRDKVKSSLSGPVDLGPTDVQITTDKGITGIGYGGPGAGFVIENHLTKLLMGEDPFDVERLWDIMWRSTLYYGRKGMVVHAISAVDNALWDLIGKALNVPVYQLLGGKVKDRIPAYCTGNDLEQHVEFGFKKLKYSTPHAPVDGWEGLRKNVELAERSRRLLGPDGEVMLDCWMSCTEDYAVEYAKMLEPYRVYWMEECLPPDDYDGFRQLNKQIRSTRIATGEHIYTRYGFQLLLEYDCARIWQPDMRWCGGLTELRRIAAMAEANNIPLIPHGGFRGGCMHFIISNTNSQWCEIFMPPPGGPREVYEMYEEEYGITRGPEGIYVTPPDRPGFGFEVEV